MFFVAVTALSTATLLGAGIYAALSNRDTVLSTITFVIGFLGVLLTAIQTYPSVTRHLQGSWRFLVYLLIIVFLLISMPSVWIVLQRPVIKIGVSLPFTSGDKQDALPILRAVTLAVREEDGIGNFDLEIIPFDDSMVDDGIQFMSSDGENILKSGRLADITNDAQVAGIIGPFNSGAALVEIPQAGDALIPLISPSTTLDCLTSPECDGKNMNGKRTFFRVAVPDQVRGRVLAEHLAKERIAADKRSGARTKGTTAGTDSRAVAVFTDSSLFGKNFGAAFANAWRENHPQDDAPIMQSVNEDYDKVIRDMNPVPGIVLFAGTGPKGISLFQTIQNDARFSNVVFAGAGTIMNEAFSGGLQNGIRGRLYAVTPMPYDDTSREIVDFNSAYRSANGQQAPTPYSASAYDATRSLLVAIRAAIISVRPPVTEWGPLSSGQSRRLRDKILTKLRSLNRGKGVDYSGITGTFNFNSDGDVDYDGTDEARLASVYRFYNPDEGGKRKGWHYEEPSQ